MQREHIAQIIAAPILILIILWAPLHDFISPSWRSFNADVRKKLPKKSRFR
jgi:hypothetical protein